MIEKKRKNNDKNIRTQTAQYHVGLYKRTHSKIHKVTMSVSYDACDAGIKPLR